MSKKNELKLAYIAKIQNKKARTSASKEYFYVSVEDGESYLFTVNDLEKAQKRASKNLEDTSASNFVKPPLDVVEKIVEVPVEKVIEVPAKGIFAKLFQGLINTIS
jgi:hypothetical protein